MNLLVNRPLPMVGATPHMCLWEMFAQNHRISESRFMSTPRSFSTGIASTVEKQLATGCQSRSTQTRSMCLQRPLSQLAAIIHTCAAHGSHQCCNVSAGVFGSLVPIGDRLIIADHQTVKDGSIFREDLKGLLMMRSLQEDMSLDLAGAKSLVSEAQTLSLGGV